MRYVAVDTPRLDRDLKTGETILTVHTRRDVLNNRDMSFLSIEEFEARVNLILTSLNAQNKGES